jgi:hypothetical protein
MSRDGKKLASLADDLVFWDVVEPFDGSRPTLADVAVPERPRVELSPDGLFIAISGDAWYGKRALPEEPVLIGPRSSNIHLPSCIYGQAIFSPDGRWLAGTYQGSILIYAVSDLEARNEEPAYELEAACVSIGFSPDGKVLATSTGARYETDTFTPLSSGLIGPPVQSFLDSMEVAVDGDVLYSSCSTGGGPACSGEAPFPKFSPDGHWVVAGATVRNRATNERVVLDPTARVGIFAPNGDVIAAGADESITRYCRSER